MTRRVGLIGLGCAKNRVDAEIMLAHLQRAGWQVTSDLDTASTVIINTCGFITDAKQESIDRILEVAERRRSGEVRRLLVAGCMAQRFARELAAEIPEIDGFVGLDELAQVVARVERDDERPLPDQRASVALYDAKQPRIVSTPGYAYLKVAEGCDNPCRFCTIPQMRGRFRSRPIDDLVAEARQLDRAGVAELVLVAQDTTRYGQDLGLEHGLSTLLEQLHEHTGIPWLRFLYAYPSTLDEHVLELMANSERVVSYLDIPFQHASRAVLQAMRRGGSGAQFLDLLQRARSQVPDLAVRTTLMVGHPGEGEEEFSELLQFVTSARFDNLGVFTYCWQEENPGAELGDPVPEPIKQERYHTLMATQQSIAHELNQQLVGCRLPAIVEGPLEEMELLLHARVARQAPEIDGRLLINDGWAPSGSLVEVEVTEAHPYDLLGRLTRVIRPGARTVLEV